MKILVLKIILILKLTVIFFVILISIIQFYFFLLPLFFKYSQLSIPNTTSLQPANIENPAQLIINNSDLYVEGDDSQSLYQVISPQIFVLPFRDYKFSLPIIEQQGKIGVGILNKNYDKWLLNPTGLYDEYIFNSRFNTKISIVIANANQENSKKTQSIFTIQGQ